MNGMKLPLRKINKSVKRPQAQTLEWHPLIMSKAASPELNKVLTQKMKFRRLDVLSRTRMALLFKAITCRGKDDRGPRGIPMAEASLCAYSAAGYDVFEARFLWARRCYIQVADE